MANLTIVKPNIKLDWFLTGIYFIWNSLILIVMVNIIFEWRVDRQSIDVVKSDFIRN